jgi:carboxyl-terminal processing protease
MAESLNDCHTAFTDPQQVEEQMARLRGDVRFAGVGIRIKRRPDEPIIIWELLDGGTAGKAGLKPGDAIVKVDGQEAAALTLEQIAGMIRGPAGTQVKLTVEHADSRRVQDVSLKRVQIAEPAFASRLLPGNVAYLRLFSFSQVGQNELLQAVRQYEGQSPRGWIIDLRTNGGGELQVLLSLLSKFLKDGPFAYQVDRRGQWAAFGPDGTYLPRQHPLVVLVSDSTSSAAELFAAAVQHYGAGKVVGTKTAGCLGIGNRFELPDGSGLSVTVSRLLGPDGGDLNKVGVVPTDAIEVSRADLAAGRDPQLDRALALLGVRPK